MEIFENKEKDEIRAIYEDTIDRRLRCDDTCPFHSMCPLVKFSSGGRRCPAQNLSADERMRMINLFFLGEEGLKFEVLRSIYQLARLMDLEGDPRNLLQYIEVLMKATKTYYGNKPKQEGKAPDNEIKIMTVGEISPNTPCLVLPNADPESLYDSPVIDAIMEERRNREE